MERLEPYRGEHPEGHVETAIIIPVDPAAGRVFGIGEGPIGACGECGGADALGLEWSVHLRYSGTACRFLEAASYSRIYYPGLTEVRGRIMARKTQVILTDDIDGSEATGTVRFALDGVSYEIDLNDENAQRMRDQLNEWTGKARRVGGRRNTGARSSSSDAGKVRAWAKENGYEVSDRGRVSKEVREAYYAAH